MVAMEGLGDAYNANSNFSQAIESYEQLTGSEDSTICCGSRYPEVKDGEIYA